jgi:hypothetical protein
MYSYQNTSFSQPESSGFSTSVTGGGEAVLIQTACGSAASSRPGCGIDRRLRISDTDSVAALSSKNADESLP